MSSQLKSECANNLAGDYLETVIRIVDGNSTTVKTTREAGIIIVETYDNNVLRSRNVSRDPAHRSLMKFGSNRY